MKTNYYFPRTTVLFIVGICLAVSCSSVKKTAIDCPDITVSRYHKADPGRAHRKATTYKRNNTSRYSYSGIKRNRKSLASATAEEYVNHREVINITKSDYNNNLTAFMPVDMNTGSKLIILNSKEIWDTDLKTDLKNDASFSNEPQKCDTIVMRSGLKYIGKVEEIGLSEVKYRRCDNLTGPVISVLKSNVNVIKYSNGTNDYFTSNDYIPSAQPSYTTYSADKRFAGDSRKNQGLAVAGFVTSLVGLFVLSIPLGLLSIIFGAVSLGKIRKNPSRYKGKGFAIAALIIGLVDVVAMIVLLSTVAVY
jgi:hypothetical protein